MNAKSSLKGSGMRKSSTAKGDSRQSQVAAKKKMEGFDRGQKRADPASRMKTSNATSTNPYGGSGLMASSIGNNFNQNVERLKNQGVKQVEDEYIKALQEEIKILEYQMKILKDKEIEQQAAVSQIDRFFSDGVPLNDNILALKTQYQNQKSEEEKHLENLRRNINDHDKRATDLESEIQYYRKQRDLIDKDREAMEDGAQKLIDDLKKEIYNEKHMKTELEKKIREKQEQFKRYTDSNLKMNRDLEKDRVLSTHNSETAATRRYKMERDIETMDAKIKDLNDEIGKLEGENSLNPQINGIEAENNELRRKILNLEKEISMAQAKIKEAEFLLDTRRKERANESQLKKNLQNNIEMTKVKIDQAHSMNELIIEQKVKEKQEMELRQKDAQIDKVNEQCKNVKRNIGTEELEIEQICQDKVKLQQDIIEQEQIKEKVDKDLGTSGKQCHDMKIQFDFLEDKYKQLSTKVEPMKANEAKIKEIIPKFENDIKNYQEQLANLEKQIEFAKQVKGLNFNDVRLLNSSNDNINGNIMNFIKKYEDIQRMSRLQSNLS